MSGAGAAARERLRELHETGGELTAAQAAALNAYVQALEDLLAAVTLSSAAQMSRTVWRAVEHAEGIRDAERLLGLPAEG